MITNCVLALFVPVSLHLTNANLPVEEITVALTLLHNHFAHTSGKNKPTHSRNGQVLNAEHART